MTLFLYGASGNVWGNKELKKLEKVHSQELKHCIAHTCRMLDHKCDEVWRETRDWCKRNYPKLDPVQCAVDYCADLNKNCANECQEIFLEKSRIARHLFAKPGNDDLSKCEDYCYLTAMVCMERSNLKKVDTCNRKKVECLNSCLH